MVVTKTNIYFSTIIFMLLMCIFVLTNFENYYKKTKNKEKELLMIKSRGMGEKVFIGTTLVGFITYFYKQYKERKNFSFFKFIMGVSQCGS